MEHLCKAMPSRVVNAGVQRKGTTVDGKSIPKNKPAQLQHRSVVVLGESPHTLTYFERSGEQAAGCLRGNI